jgi:predicted nucleic acid-binding protein
LAICPVTYVELAPVFNGDQTVQQEFLANLGVTWPETWIQADSEEAYRAWHRYAIARRAAKSGKRPIADILIGAFASRFDGILTRNESDFKSVFPNLSIVGP